MTPAQHTPCVIYLRVSRASKRARGEEGEEELRLGLLAQEEACRREADRRGWVVLEVIPEVISGGSVARPEFNRACALAREHHGVLLAAKSDRISRGSVASVLALHEQAGREGWHVYAIDLPEIDTTSPMGELILTVLAGINRFERRMIGLRTKEALAQARKHGTKSGKPIGHPRLMPQETVDRLAALRGQGMTFQQVADTMNEAEHYGPLGGVWRKKDVYYALKRHGSTSKEAA